MEDHAYFKRLGTSLLLRRPGYSPRTVSVGFLLNSVGQGLLRTVSVGQGLLQKVRVGFVLNVVQGFLRVRQS
jgi:hypothetical protein